MSNESPIDPCECDTLVECPLCATCPVCKGRRMITFEQAVEFERLARMDLVGVPDDVDASKTDPPPHE